MNTAARGSGSAERRISSVGPQIFGGAISTELAHTGSLGTPAALAVSGSTIWIGSSSSPLLESISFPGDTGSAYNLSTGHNVSGVGIDGSGRPWIADPNATSIGYLASGATTVTEYNLGSTYATAINGGVLGPDGNMYFGSSGNVMIASTSSPGSFSYVSASGYAPKYGANGPHGTMWFTSNGYLIQLDFTGSTLSAAYIDAIATAGDVFGPIVEGADGKMYVIDNTTDSIIQVTLDSSGNPTAAHSYSVGYALGGLAAADDGDTDIWFSIPSQNYIGDFNPGTSNIDLHFNPPSSSSGPTPLAVTSDDSIWWGEASTGLVGVYGDIQNFAAVYFDNTNLHAPAGSPGYSAGYSNITPQGGAIIESITNNCAGYTYTLDTPLPSGTFNAIGLYTTSSYTGSGTCGIIVNTNKGSGELFVTE